MSSQDRYLVPVLAAVLLHGAAAAALQIADEPSEDPDDDVTEVSLEEPPPPEPEPEPPKPPEPPPEPEQPEPVIAKKIEVKPTPRRNEPVRKKPVIVPDETDLEPAGGDESGPAPGGVFKMDDIVPTGTAMGGVGGGQYSGSGGDGAGSGTGAGEGTGKGPPKPVSIAAIKKRAMPLNNSDLTDKLANKVSGDVVVKLVISDKGKVLKATLIKRLDPAADRKALSLARKLRFSPAVDTNDKPVTSVVNWTFSFRPPG